MFKKKIKKAPSSPSAMYRLHLNLEESSELLGRVREQIQKEIDGNRLSKGTAQKMEWFVFITSEVDKTVCAYDAILRGYFNMEKKNDDQRED
ncbi:MAG: hypothetical protein E7679_04780 [Ruminococcaceae bacterium]|nr:hypothetical protein [Oscillospiraceae bacterium]